MADGETGELVDGHSPEAWADALEHLLDDDMRATLRKLRLSTFADIFFDLAAADDANTALPEEIFLKAVEETGHSLAGVKHRPAKTYRYRPEED